MGSLIEAYFDACCEPVNPGGHGAWGILVKVDGVTVRMNNGYVGQGDSISNNVCEYSGFIAVVDWILNANLLGITIIRGDSKLVIFQLSGKWKVKGGLYIPFYEKAKYLLSILQERTENNVSLEWIPRDKNFECDELSKNVLRRMGIKFRLQPDKENANANDVGTP